MVKIKSEESSIVIPLNDKFVFSHEPISVQNKSPMFERDTTVLQDRIKYSTGGAFLITGFRGVGKTSFINQALKDIKYINGKSVNQKTRIVPIYINLSRKMSASEVMHHLVRQIYTELDEIKLLRRFPKKFNKLISIAYQRTAFSISYNQNTSIGQDASLAPTSVFNIGWSGSKSTSKGEALEFLGYDDKSAEYDVIRILRELNIGYKRFFRRVSIRPIIIFDEIDKLNLADEQDKTYLLELISTLKTILTTSGSIFIFIGGKDLHDVWLEETQQPDSIYESVFAHDLYLSCLWNLSDQIVEHYTQDLSSYKQTFLRAMQNPRYRLKKHLAYRGRGIARRVIRELNKLVYSVQKDQLSVVLDAELWDQVRLFSDVEDLIQERVLPQIRRLARDDVQYDDLIQSIYYICDHILGTDGITFSHGSLVKYFGKQSFFNRNRNLGSLVQILIKLFLDENYIEIFEQKNIGDISISDSNQYRLHNRIKKRLRNFGDFDRISDDALPNNGQIGNYQLIQLAGQGGMSDVYEAIHKQSNNIIAIKLLRQNSNESWNQIAREILQREAYILQQNLHPNIVTLFESRISEEISYLCIEKLNGYDFQDLIQSVDTGLDSNKVITLVRSIAQPVQSLHDQGYYRLDLKPDNFYIDRLQNRVVLIDVGTAIHPEFQGSQAFHGIIGTKGFMAPEMNSGSSLDDWDKRVDIYSLGVIMYLLLTGRQGVIRLDSNPELFKSEDILVSNDHNLTRIIQRATNVNLSLRYQTVNEFLNDLPDVNDTVVSVIAEILGFSYNSSYNSDSEDSPFYTEIIFGDDRSTKFPNDYFDEPMPVIKNETNFGIEYIPDQNRTSTIIENVGGGDGDVPRTDLQVSNYSSLNSQNIIQIWQAITGNVSATTIEMVFQPEKTITIGRSSENDVVIMDKTVSRYVGEIYVSGGTLWFNVFRDTSPVLSKSDMKKIDLMKEIDSGETLIVGSSELLIRYNLT